MSSNFFAYSGYDHTDTDELWINAIISLDTNTLLNTYKMTPDGRKQFLRVLQTFKERLWMPYQIGKEFYSNRRLVIETELKALGETKQSLKNSIKTMADGLEKSAIRFRPQLANDLQKELNYLKDKISLMIDQCPDKMDRNEYFVGPTLKVDDPISKEIFEIFGDKIGDGFNPRELLEIYEEGANRYNLSIPPGFKDAVNKEDYRKYGDLVIWKELIRRATEKKQPIIFITDDSKPDWWERHNQLKRPHPELLDEFYRSSGQYVHIYSYNEFIDRASVIITNFPESAKAVEEIMTINEEERERLLEHKEMHTTPMPGDIYNIRRIPSEPDVIPVLLINELENGLFHAFPITSSRNLLNIKFPTIYCAGKLFAVLIDCKQLVHTESLRALYDRIDQQQLLNVLDNTSKVLD
ncbi:PIN-like domain-containing protein [Paenibacillus ihuae]|uniref:PIN-like domain-containing protein n=1 Tax=Paenibacillus ihuae TaxID=1232431 RepID=UPI0006D535C2|nr:PIN-like domain-containing protein [Paenibacillus ihuae]